MIHLLSGSPHNSNCPFVGFGAAAPPQAGSAAGSSAPLAGFLHLFIAHGR